MECINCGKEIKGNKFCDNKCQAEYFSNMLLQKWLELDAYERKITSPARRWILSNADNKCSMCGWHEVNEYTNKIPLEIDHIDGNPINNSIDNLRVLCPNCHSLTATYKGANKNSTREYRKKYYKTVRFLSEQKKKDAIEELKEKVINGNINFEEFGWCKRVAEIIEMTPQKTRDWMKRHLPKIEANAYKRKI
ncbi:MAG: HNH endonuclease signature motif containing protein [Candidatus Pacearchaeota archaeon]|jgi:hypothetical protein|nr:HNH endonuclease [Clostridia bacterium]